MPKFGLWKMFRRYWAPLIISCVLVSVALCFGIELKTTPSARETFSLFADFPYGSLKDKNLESHIKEVDPTLKIASAFSFDPNSSDYQTYYSTWSPNCDMFLFSGEYLENKDVSEFVPLDSLGVSDGYKVNGITYGLKADLSGSVYFSNSEGTYYCFFRKTSVHLGSLDESSQSDLCLTLAKDLFRVKLPARESSL